MKEKESTFVKYQHLERFGTSEVEGIQFGTCYVFPKIDGTNASVWFDGELQCGSRKRHLSIEEDNAGFCKWVYDNPLPFLSFFEEHPYLYLYGEWLVPHALKTYREDAWQNFYVFDVVGFNGDEKIYMPYDKYKPILEKHGIDYVPEICKVHNGSYDQFIDQLKHNTFLIQEGKGTGEGIVIKNYDFKNKYGRTTWAKIVTHEFKEKHAKVHGGHEVKGKKMVEEEIALEFVTQSLVDKEFSKIEAEGGFASKDIPRLLNTVFYEIIREESWSFLKKHNFPIIDYKTLRHFVFNEVKNKKRELFGII